MKKILSLVFAFNFLFCFEVYAKTLSDIPEHPVEALIMIHGYGGDGHRVKWMTNALKQSLPDTAFYYPTAPDKAPIGGYQWFIIPKFGDEIKEKALYDKMMKDALRNAEMLHRLVDEIHQETNIPYQKIYVAGFSQGGLMAVLTALTNSHQLSKAISFSGVPLLLTPDFTTQLVKAYPEILLMQGNNDRAIPKKSLEMSTATLNQLQIEPETHIIPGLPHRINNQELEYMVKFLKN